MVYLVNLNDKFQISFIFIKDVYINFKIVFFRISFIKFYETKFVSIKNWKIEMIKELEVFN